MTFYLWKKIIHKTDTKTINHGKLKQQRQVMYGLYANWKSAADILLMRNKRCLICFLRDKNFCSMSRKAVIFLYLIHFKNKIYDEEVYAFGASLLVHRPFRLHHWLSKCRSPWHESVFTVIDRNFWKRLIPVFLVTDPVGSTSFRPIHFNQM